MLFDVLLKMNARIVVGIFCILNAQSLKGAVLFSAMPNSEGVFSTVEIFADRASVPISTASEFIGADISVESLLGDPASLLIFQITDTPLATLPSPPFTLGGIEYPGSPSRLIYRQEFSLTETQVEQFADLDNVTLNFSGGSLAAPVSLTLTSIPEPGNLSMLALAGLASVFMRRNRNARKKTGEQDAAGQPATRPESRSEGNQISQPESEGRSR